MRRQKNGKTTTRPSLRSDLLSPAFAFIAPIAVIALVLLIGRDVCSRYLAAFYHRQAAIRAEAPPSSGPSSRSLEAISQRLQLLRKGISLDPDNPVLHSTLASLFEEIADDAQLLISLQSESPSLLDDIRGPSHNSRVETSDAQDGRGLLGPSDFLLLALDEYQTAIRRVPMDAVYHAKLGRLYIKLAALSGPPADMADSPNPHLPQIRYRAQAETELEIALALEPQTPALHFIIGSYFLESGNIARALEIYCETMELDGNHLAQVLDQLKMAGVSPLELGNALDKQPPSTRTSNAANAQPFATDRSVLKLTFVKELISRGDYGIAEALLRRWIRSSSHPHGPGSDIAGDSAVDFESELRRNLASLYERQKKYDAAIAELELLAEIDPQATETRLRIVTNLQRQGKLEAAIAELKSLAAANPKDAKIKLLLINALNDRGDASSAEEAESLCREAIELDLDGFTFHNRLAELLSDKKKLKASKSADGVQSRLDEAERHFREAIRLSPNNIAYRLKVADWLSSNGKRDSAIRELKALLSICRHRSQRAQAHVRLGDLYVATKKSSEALDHFKDAVELEPNNSRWLLRLGGFYEATGRINSAIEAFEKAHKLSPSDSRIKAALEKAHKHRAKLQRERRKMWERR